MKIIHRNIDFDRDREYVLECHCQINYECDCTWARRIPYQQYRGEWFQMKSQVEEFWSYLQETAKESRTIAEIIEDEKQCAVGYLWAPFHADQESGFYFMEIQDVYIEEEFRRQGVAEELIGYAADKAKKHEAKVIRSGTGSGNVASIRLHEKLGFYAYRYEFEKEL